MSLESLDTTKITLDIILVLTSHIVIPAKAGNPCSVRLDEWVPAFAGMTGFFRGFDQYWGWQLVSLIKKMLEKIPISEQIGSKTKALR